MIPFDADPRGYGTPPAPAFLLCYPKNRSRSPSHIWRNVRLLASSLARSATIIEVTDEA